MNAILGSMSKYIRELLQILSISLLLLSFPNLVLASQSSLSDLIDQKISRMSVDEKVGQLFMVGFPYRKMTPELEDFISKNKPGSFLLFKRNITSVSQIKELNSALLQSSYKHTRLPPLIAIDQEGGSVSRLPITPAQPSALAIGQTQSPLLAEGIGIETGRFLREVGFNMNLAPVLDVSDPFLSSFIGVRSFGSDPQVVADIGVAYAKGLLKAKVIPTAKHFPGSGSIIGDPHHAIVKNENSLESLQQHDLRPFQEYSQLGDEIAIMLSHFIYPALDEAGEPASFSKKISTELLRDKMKYQGLVMTDDLQMQGSRQLLRPEAAALRAIKAGADIVMLTWSTDDQRKAFKYLKNAVLSGELAAAELNQKVHRILTAKAFVNSYKKSSEFAPQMKGQQLTSLKYSKVESEIFDHNLKANLIERTTLESDRTKERRPASVAKICVMAPSREFVSSFRKNVHMTIETTLLTNKITANQVRAWIKGKRCSITLSAVTGKKSAAILRSLSSAEKEKMLIVNFGSQSLIHKASGFLKVLQLYFNHADSGKKIAQNLSEILRDINFQLASN